MYKVVGNAWFDQCLLMYYFLYLYSGVLRRSNDTARILITTIMGMVLGYFIGASFPSVYLSKVWSAFLSYLLNEDVCHRLGSLYSIFCLSSAGRSIFLQVLWHLLTWPLLMILIVLQVAVFLKTLVLEVLLWHLRYCFSRKCNFSYFVSAIEDLWFSSHFED